MEYIVNAKEMKYCDENTINHYGIPALVLMERAALAVTEEIIRRGMDCRNVLILCGSGNNGADGLAVARLLHLKGICVHVYLAGDKKHFSPQMKQQYEIAQNYKIPFVSSCEPGYSLVVDAVFGIGLSRKPDDALAQLFEQINQWACDKLSVDIPSGVSADHGNLMGAAFHADVTVTFAYKKLGMLLHPAADCCGSITVADIGINSYSWLERKPSMCHLTKDDLCLLAQRPADGNKGTFGKVLLIAGTVNMAGAAVLAAKAAYRSGCGLVRVYTPEENRMILQTAIPEAILTTYSMKKPDLTELNECLAWADVIIIGPGLGKEDAARIILKNTLQNAAVPMVVDADALNILSEQPEQLLKPHTEMIVTPHVGEMARLTGLAASYIKENILQAAEEFARTYNVICVLKDSRSIISVPYGKTYLNITGNDGMATAGSGDVLSGIIGSFLAQGNKPEYAAALGVYVHGLAGDVACQQCGSRSMMAQDLVESIDVILKECR
ncbi:MAG: NAD(P)H-hydrate dehydratase [Roseburia sp.]